MKYLEILRILGFKSGKFLDQEKLYGHIWTAKFFLKLFLKFLIIHISLKIFVLRIFVKRINKNCVVFLYCDSCSENMSLTHK